MAPVNGSIYSFMLIWSLAWFSSSWFRTYSLMIFSFFPTVSTYIPSTKMSGFHIYTSNLHVGQRSLVNFCSWEISWIVIYLSMIVYSPACGCDLGMLLLQWFPPSSRCTISSVFLLYLSSAVRIFLSADTLARTLCNTRIGNSNALYVFLHFSIR